MPILRSHHQSDNQLQCAERIKEREFHAQSRRALEYPQPDNLPILTATTYTLGYAYQLQGDYAAASQAYTEVISISKSFGDSVYATAATLGLGQVQEAENQLHTVAETYPARPAIGR